MTLGVALSISFSSPESSPLPLVLVGILIIFFLMLEARRYRYFNVFRAQARWLETHFYAPLLYDGDLHMEQNWQKVLAQDYLRPEYHVGYMTQVGRRIRRNYLWVLMIQPLAYVGKLAVHPAPVQSVDEFMRRGGIGPLQGEFVVAMGLVYLLSWSGIAIWSEATDRRRARSRGSHTSMG